MKKILHKRSAEAFFHDRFPAGASRFFLTDYSTYFVLFNVYLFTALTMQSMFLIIASAISGLFIV